MHTGVLNRWEMDIVFFFAIGELDFGRFKLALRALRYLLLAKWYTTLLTNLLVQLNHVSFCIIAITLIFALLVDEDLSPEWILGNIYSLLRLE